VLLDPFDREAQSLLAEDTRDITEFL